MSRHSYLKWPSDRSDHSSWHVLTIVDEVGWHLRCGRLITTDTAKGSATLPLGELTCETCARLILHDAEAAP